MLVRALTTRLVNKHVARRLVRVIPHPGVRAVAMVLSSALVSHLVEKTIAKAAGKVRWSRFASRRVESTAHV